MVLHVCVLMCSPLDTVTNGAPIFSLRSIGASFFMCYYIVSIMPLSIPFLLI